MTFVPRTHEDLAKEDTDRLDNGPAQQVCDTLLAGFVDYMAADRLISGRASSHFAKHEWSAQEADALQRLTLHRETVWKAVDQTAGLLDDVPDRRGEWRQARNLYQRRIAERTDQGLAETFFNSVTRRIFTTIGVDNDVELRWFGATAVPRGEARTELFTTLARDGDSAALVESALASFDLGAPWADLAGDARRVAARLDSFLLEAWGGLHLDGLDMVSPVFYRNKGAYLIGRARFLNRVTPFVLPILHDDDGLRVDTVLLTETQASRLFGFTRSYFFVDWHSPSELVGFLKSLLPAKSLHELYTGIGYPQHGKSSLYRSLYRHLQTSTDKFVRARGTPGMVMTVFTLVSFNVVFKVIKDRFDPPKNTTREAVQRRYELVYSRDRVGRMVDAQEFQNLSFDQDRFDPDLLEKLLNEAAETVKLVGDQVVISHTYTERQVYPLNLYLQEMQPDRAEAAAIDWGWAIKDLAAANVWPGDLFTKNFGVTRHGTVVFYDYDELTLLEECRFRVIPDSDEPEHEMRSQPWFAVRDGDVFPEQFPTFMSFPRKVPTQIWERFVTVHGDLFTVGFWEEVQAQLAEGALPGFYPYPDRLRFRRDADSTPL
jgi:isocitrate dehydrogenase kinase/phosphatase